MSALREVKVFTVDVTYKGVVQTITVMARCAHDAQDKARELAAQEGLSPVILSWPFLVETYVVA